MKTMVIEDRKQDGRLKPNDINNHISCNWSKHSKTGVVRLGLKKARPNYMLPTRSKLKKHKWV